MSSQIPPLSFFLDKIVATNNLISGLFAYQEILDDELKMIDIYEDPMKWVEKVDYRDTIASFLSILIDERKRTQESANKGENNAGADENAEKNR